MLIIGDILHGVVIKNVPHMDSYLVWIYGKELFATLPKIHALKEYRIQEQVFASVMDIKGARITLSQKIPQFTKAMFSLHLRDFLKEHSFEIHRAVIIPPQALNNSEGPETTSGTTSGLGKILVKSSNNDIEFKELNALFKPELPKLPDIYKNIRLYFIPFREDPVELIKECLQPAPKDKILSVQAFGPRDFTVLVPKENLGGYLGKNGVNLKTAARLANCNITIEGV
jgi:transcription antitermination factor NusA-like protein